jgi:hypothetical protein
MQIEELARLLKSAVVSAEEREKSTAFHLFGVRYASAFDTISAHEVAVRAGFTKNWGAEIRKGVRLARYVSIK